nr:glycosyltransferase [Synechococcus sp. RSCCF101]
MPRVSVVMPFRNAARWLSEALASLARQTLPEWELLAVDDASDDESRRLVEAWSRRQRQPVRLINGGGAGVSAARNRGWQQAAAPLVAFLDADDRMGPQRLEQQAGLLEAEPGLAHVMGGWQRVDAGGRPLARVAPWEEGADFSLRGSFQHKAVLPSAWMLRRSVLEALGGFDPALAHAEDVDLLLRLARAGHAGRWLRASVCDYRVHGEGASRDVAGQCESLLFVVNRQLQAVPDRRLPAREKRGIQHGSRAWTAWLAWRKQQPELAFNLWRTAWGLSPYGAASTVLHLAENAARSDRRVGAAGGAAALLGSAPWQALEATVAQELQRPARARQRLRGLRDGLRRDLAAGSELWQPDALAAWAARASGDLDRLDGLRQAVISWLQAALAATTLEPTREGRRLGELLIGWAGAFSRHDTASCVARLADAFELIPCRELAGLLARLQERRYPGGAAALAALAARLPEEPGLASALAPCRQADPLPSSPDRAEPIRCQGPWCPPCVGELEQAWRRQPLAVAGGAGGSPVLERWHARGEPEGEPASEGPLPLTRLAGGHIWLRPPAWNPWGHTHAVAVMEAGGQRRPELSRRYPLGWPGCRAPASELEPPPAVALQPLRGPVLAVADLSAETHYHRLLEWLPRLGLALEALGSERHTVRVWHNGGRGSELSALLERCLGLGPERQIHAAEYPWIRAEELIVPGFCGPYGQPSAAGRRWLRRTLLPDPPGQAADGAGRWLWLSRAPSWRRPIWNEPACLAALAARGLEIEALRPDGLPLEEQARRLAGARRLCIPHGAALANLVFAAPGSTVLELLQPGYTPPFSLLLSRRGGLDLARCLQPERAPRALRSLLFESAVTEPIVLDPERIGAAMEALAA